MGGSAVRSHEHVPKKIRDQICLQEMGRVECIMQLPGELNRREKKKGNNVTVAKPAGGKAKDSRRNSQGHGSGSQAGDNERGFLRSAREKQTKKGGGPLGGCNHKGDSLQNGGLKRGGRKVSGHGKNSPGGVGRFHPRKERVRKIRTQLRTA